VSPLPHPPRLRADGAHLAGRPQETVSEAGSGSSLATLMDGELVALGEHLELEGGSRSDASAK